MAKAPVKLMLGSKELRVPQEPRATTEFMTAKPATFMLKDCQVQKPHKDGLKNINKKNNKKSRLRKRDF